MKRKILEKLTTWKDKPGRMPLIFHGARQVGKTYILKEFAVSHFSRFVYVNLETDATTSAIFDGDLNPLRLVQYLETVTDIRIIDGETLIILDEMQSQ